MKALADAALPGIHLDTTPDGKPRVHCDAGDGRRRRVLQAAGGKPALRDAFSGKQHHPRLPEAAAALRQRLLTIPGATATRNGRVYVPVASLAANPQPLIDGLREFVSAMGSPGTAA
jgi:hypothetical protein